MSILPPRTSPTSPTDSPVPSEMVALYEADLAWTVRWAVRRRTPSSTTSGPAESKIVDADLFARLSGSAIELELRDATGSLIEEQCLPASPSTRRTGSGTVIDWAPTDPDVGIRARLLLANGREPVLRTNLPGLLGILGGRYDLARITPDDPPNVAGRISGDS